MWHRPSCLAMSWTFFSVMLYGDCTWGCLHCIINSPHDMFIEDACMHLAKAASTHDIDMYHVFACGIMHHSICLTYHRSWYSRKVYSFSHSIGRCMPPLHPLTSCSNQPSIVDFWPHCVSLPRLFTCGCVYMLPSMTHGSRRLHMFYYLGLPPLKSYHCALPFVANRSYAF